MSTKQLDKFKEELDIPDNVQVTYKSNMLQVSGPLGKTYKSFKKMVITNSHALDKQMRIFRDHGMSREKRYVHVVPGFNYRMTNMQAAVGIGQVKHLDQVLLKRNSQEKLYKKLFSTCCCRSYSLCFWTVL